jgi:hypothetical protein
MASYDDIEVSFTYGKTCMSYKEPSKLLRQYIYVCMSLLFGTNSRIFVNSKIEVVIVLPVSI